MDYVIVLARPMEFSISPADIPILIVEKQKPEWQKGRFNLPGGKIEPGESSAQASLREIFEEAGGIVTSSSMPPLMGVIQGSWGSVYCHSLYADPLIPIQQGENETERVFWMPWRIVKDDPRLIPNLRVVIPMMLMGVQDWNIYDEGPSWGKKTHVIDIEVKNGWPKEEE